MTATPQPNSKYQLSISIRTTDTLDEKLFEQLNSMNLSYIIYFYTLKLRWLKFKNQQSCFSLLKISRKAYSQLSFHHTVPQLPVPDPNRCQTPDTAPTPPVQAPQTTSESAGALSPHSYSFQPHSSGELSTKTVS